MSYFSFLSIDSDVCLSDSEPTICFGGRRASGPKDIGRSCRVQRQVKGGKKKP